MCNLIFEMNLRIMYKPKKLISQLLHLFEVRHISNSGRVVYLTFDDGPESGITEFILETLKQYGYKATFFCRGDNAQANTSLLQLIIQEGCAVGNHTFSHIHAFKTSTSSYISNVERADEVLHTSLFRPPWGAMTFSTFFHLHRRYKIIYWNRISGDTDLNNFNKERNLANLKKTQSGDIVLFHCCHRHEKETKQILPEYLKWLHEQKYECKVIK